MNNELIRLLNECARELDQIGIEYKPVDRIYYASIGSYLGLCWRYHIQGREHYEIKISKGYENATDTKLLRNTIMHELLHTVDFDCGHNGNWKVCAEKVNKAFGYDIQRTVDLGKKLDDEQAYEMGYRYKITCLECGAVSYRKKYSKNLGAINNHVWYISCNRCHKNNMKAEKIYLDKF